MDNLDAWLMTARPKGSGRPPFMRTKAYVRPPFMRRERVPRPPFMRRKPNGASAIYAQNLHRRGGGDLNYLRRGETLVGLGNRRSDCLSSVGSTRSSFQKN